MAYLDIKEIYGILKVQEIKWIFQLPKARKSIDIDEAAHEKRTKTRCA